MSWLQLQLITNAENAPVLEALMEDAGAISVTMADAEDEPLFEPAPGETPLWHNILISGLYPQGTRADDVIAHLEAEFLPLQLPTVSTRTLENRNWQRACMDDFKPMRFGRRLWICPSWCKPPEPEAVNLILDPGLAFGTGTHATTALCLQWLDSADIHGQTIIDYGCGSGILGIAALLLGAATIHGVDNDPQALLATRDNAVRNCLSPATLHTWLPEDFACSRERLSPCDGIVANILAEPLIELADYLASLVKPGGWLLLSGILEKQAEDVMAAYRPWFEISALDNQDGWVRVGAKRVGEDH